MVDLNALDVFQSLALIALAEAPIVSPKGSSVRVTPIPLAWTRWGVRLIPQSVVAPGDPGSSVCNMGFTWSSLFTDLSVLHPCSRYQS